MIKTYKYLSVVIIITVLLVSIHIPGVYAAEQTTATREVEETFIIIGSYSIWRHADGKTWQKGVAPDSHVEYASTIKYPGTSPIEKVKKLDSVTFYNGETQADKELWGNTRGLWGELFDEAWYMSGGYKDSSVKSATFTADNIGNGEVNLIISTDLIAKDAPLDCKEEWQATLVKGYKYYIPRVETWIIEEEVPTDDYRFTFSTFSNNEINENKPKYEFTFYIADFENRGVEEKFYVDLWHHMEINWVEKQYKSFTLSLDANKAIDWYTYEMSATPVWAVIYRKDKEWERWKDNENMHENFWNGYTKVINGETYYYYNTYYYSSDGMRFVSANDLADVPLGNKTEWINYLGFGDVTTMQNAIQKR